MSEWRCWGAASIARSTEWRAFCTPSVSRPSERPSWRAHSVIRRGEGRARGDDQAVRPGDPPRFARVAVAQRCITRIQDVAGAAGIAFRAGASDSVVREISRLLQTALAIALPTIAKYQLLRLRLLWTRGNTWLRNFRHEPSTL